MPNKTELKLYEGLVLLALHDEKGTTQGWYLEYTIAAAVLAELLMLKRIKVSEDKKNRLEVLDASLTGDLVMDEVLTKIAEKKRPDTLSNWVMTVGYIPSLKDKVVQQLVADGIIKSEERKLLWVFTQKLYPAINPEPERHLRAEMRRLILTKPLEVDPRIAVLIALVTRCLLEKEMAMPFREKSAWIMLVVLSVVALGYFIQITQWSLQAQEVVSPSMTGVVRFTLA